MTFDEDLKLCLSDPESRSIYNRWTRYYNKIFERPHWCPWRIWALWAWMTTMTLRSFLYWLARLMGDINAVRRGRIAQRLHNRIVGRIMAQLFRR